MTVLDFHISCEFSARDKADDQCVDELDIISVSENDVPVRPSQVAHRKLLEALTELRKP